MASSTDHPASFTGFPTAAFEFYEDLEQDNSKTFWQAHKQQYDAAVRAPMVALMESLSDEFGAAKVFRPYRDVRFSNDKTPYKTHQGAYVASAPGAGWYAEIGAPCFRTGGGFYRADGPALKRVRNQIAGAKGEAFATLVARLERAGWEVRGDRLKTTPRGFESDHPRIELLRHTSLSLTRPIEEEVVGTAELADRVRADWRELRPVVEWLTDILR